MNKFILSLLVISSLLVFSSTYFRSLKASAEDAFASNTDKLEMFKNYLNEFGIKLK